MNKEKHISDSQIITMPDQPIFLKLAGQQDLDEETAYTICRLINNVGWQLVDDWDWNWLEEAKGSYTTLFDRSWLGPAWELLHQKEWLSLQTVSDTTRRITTILPLESLTNLRSLVLQSNRISDLTPLHGMSKLELLICFENLVVDLEPICHLSSLEQLYLGNNPIGSFRPLERLLNLRELHISTEQFVRFSECVQLSTLEILDVYGRVEVGNFEKFPKMPKLKMLRLTGLGDLTGIGQFDSLTTVSLTQGQFSNLAELEKLPNLTHCEVRTSKPLSLEPLERLYALRSIRVASPVVSDLQALTRLPVLHEIHIDNKSLFNKGELKKLTSELTSWDSEFKAKNDHSPCPQVQIVTQEEFDLYDGLKPFGILPGECENGMFRSERIWVEHELSETLKVHFEEGYESDFLLPFNTGFRRSAKLVLYSLHSYQSFREVVKYVQEVLCETRNEWIVYFQSLLAEGQDSESLPDDAEDFIVWIYRDKILAVESDAAIVQKLLEW